MIFPLPFLCQCIFKHSQSIPDDAGGAGILAESTRVTFDSYAHLVLTEVIPSRPCLTESWTAANFLRSSHTSSPERVEGAGRGKWDRESLIHAVGQATGGNRSGDPKSQMNP